MKVYQRLSGLLAAIENCAKAGNTEWHDRHWLSVDETMSTAPHGSGFDAKTTLGASTPEKLVIETSYHHMNDGGYYDGWTDHVLTIKASLLFGYTMNVSGRNRNEIKEYIAEVFGSWLDSDI